ncbi:MAG: ABC transporter ATP-binding protein [Myxococcales bacterium]|nr:ABC transporter ATP-binding protein [Myxococcales bacterium]
MSADPLLVAAGARVLVDDAVAVASFDLSTGGRQLVLAGGVAPLFALLSNIPLGAREAAEAASRDELVPSLGRARASGSFTIAGRDVTRGEHVGFVGVAPFDPPLPSDGSATSYVTLATRLALLARGLRVGEGESARRARDALVKLGLQNPDRRTLRSLALPERRVLVLAAALASDPTVIVADRPLLGLEGEAAAFVLTAMRAAFEGRGSIVVVDRLAAGTPEGDLTRRASDVAVFFGGELALAGDPAIVLAKSRLYRVVVASNAERLQAALAARGMALEGGPAQFSLATSTDEAVSDVLRAASEVRSAVVEIVPLM